MSSNGAINASQTERSSHVSAAMAIAAHSVARWIRLISLAREFGSSQRSSNRVVESGFDGIAEKPRGHIESVLLDRRGDRSPDTIRPRFDVDARGLVRDARPLLARELVQCIEPSIERMRRECRQAGEHPEVIPESFSGAGRA